MVRKRACAGSMSVDCSSPLCSSSGRVAMAGGGGTNMRGTRIVRATAATSGKSWARRSTNAARA
ncbi:MAG: hypothetical protein WKG00_20855 [Polyangiaceae bacterium]